MISYKGSFENSIFHTSLKYWLKKSLIIFHCLKPLTRMIDLSVLLNEIINREKGKILKWDKEWKKFVYESMKPIYMKYN